MINNKAVVGKVFGESSIIFSNFSRDTMAAPHAVYMCFSGATAEIVCEITDCCR